LAQQLRKTSAISEEHNVSTLSAIHSKTSGIFGNRMMLAVLWLLLALPPAAAAGEPSAPSATDDRVQEIELAPVKIDGVTLFQVRGVSAFPAERRAKEISARIEQLASDRMFDPDTLQMSEQDNATSIVAGKLSVVSIFDADARLENLERKILAQIYLLKIRETIIAYREARTPKALVTDVLYVSFATFALLIFVWLGRRIKRRLEGLLNRRLSARLEKLESQSYQIVHAKKLLGALKGALNLLWLVASVFAAFWYLEFTLGVLPWTKKFGESLFVLLTEPLYIMAGGLVDVIPDLIFLVILFFVVRYILKALLILFDGIANQTIRFQNFDADWALPTYRLVKVLVIAFSLVVAFPYIPGSSSDAFKGISVFLGIVFSLGSSSIISNIVAGYSMTYRRAFRLGDRVRIGEHVGDVTEIRQLVTHLRTVKNEEIVVPNSLILNSSVVNYSTQARTGQLLLHTTVGIGYETPWRQVEAMLLESAARTADVKKEPSPFVLQQILGDFCVTYELNVYCDNAQAMSRLYTALHRNILDVFNEYGVQIMTPAYEGDTPEPKVVPKENWYLSPAKPPGE
jgi:small-conductance mechanosensitive channel